MKKFARLFILILMAIVVALFAIYGEDEVFALMPFHSSEPWNLFWCMFMTFVAMVLALSHFSDKDINTHFIGLYALRIADFISAFFWFVYTLYGHHVTWFLDYDRVGFFFLLIDLVISGMVLGIVAGYGLSQLTYLRYLFKTPIFSLLSLAAGIGWLIVAGSFVVHFFDEHPLLTFLVLVTAIPSGYAPVGATLSGSGRVSQTWDTFYWNGKRYFGRQGTPSSWTKMPC